jgi:hypothetical protein
MYENVQEPFLNATTMGGNAGNDLGSNPFATLLGNQGGTQVRDASNNPSATGSETTTGLAAPNTNPLPNPWNNAAGELHTSLLQENHLDIFFLLESHIVRSNSGSSNREMIIICRCL